MGKKGSSKNGTCGPQMSVTIREASTGKKHTNVKSSLKLQHIKNLAVWATRDVAIPSLGAFFGHHYAASSEALGTPVDPSLFICQRCESILHPGYNCTIRIEKNKRKTRKIYTQNSIVYTCHFCSHRNIKRGTVRNTTPPNAKPHKSSTNQKVVSFSSSCMIKDTNTITAPVEATERGKMGILEVKDDDPAASTPLTLLESKMRKRNRSGAKKPTELEEKSATTSNRRRRKSWNSLKEIAENNDNDKRRKLIDLTVPFSIGI